MSRPALPRTGPPAPPGRSDRPDLPDLSGLFGGAYRGRRVLLTGHTGFKGSWLALWLRALGAQVHGLALAPDTAPSHHALVGTDDGASRVDLRDASEVRGVLAAQTPEIVFHLAAQPLVRRGYREPTATFEVNVSGLVHLLEAVRATSSVRAVVNATTDKCYLNLEVARGYREDDRLGGHDPYSASKACAEIVSACWRNSFLAARSGAPVLLATARAGNVIGGGDWSDDRLVPDLVRGALAGRPTPIRCPNAVRPWQHVLEPLAGYLILGQRLLAGDTACARAWNFGPGPAGHLSVGRLVQALAHHWPAIALAADTAVHPHEAGLLHLDCAAAHRLLGWRPVWRAEATVARTARWYRHHAETGRPASVEDLQAYVRDARAAGLPWAAAGTDAALASRAPTPLAEAVLP